MASIEPMSVLLVEDSAPVRRRLCAMMAETTALRVVAEAATVAEATGLFDSVHPETVVLDLALPDGSGMDVLRHIRGGGGSCLVLVLTNYAGPESRQHCSDLGANYVFGKSAEFEQALETLGNLSRQRDAMEAGASPSGAHQARLVVTSRIGLRSGPAAMLVREAQAFDADLEISFDGRQANAKSILDVLLLHAGYGAEVTLKAAGEDASQAIDAITDIFARTFAERHEPSPGEAAPTRATAPRLPQGKGETILVADDDPILLRMVRTILDNNGYRTVTARDGKEAVDIFSARMEDITAVVTDIRMPTMDGIDAVFMMRRARPRLPVLAMSGATEAFALPSDADTVFMRKPFGSAELLPALRELLDHAEAVALHGGLRPEVRRCGHGDRSGAGRESR
jgi:phosphotransferase system HPr (HPr) family protein